MENNNQAVQFDLPKNQSSTIKVIGVGGGGSNAVNHMFSEGIRGVDFIVCNTDSQALDASPIPNKIQLGLTLTEGLGAGANPEVGEQAAQESIEEIERILGSNTKMVFVTAGMGGGTGTGAAPIIAHAAKRLGILTVGIVTSPFNFEGSTRQKQADEGISRLRESVDSLVVINNNKLREVYGNLGFKAGFSKADEVLATAARGIAEVITHHFTTNIDLRDAKTVLANSGTAIMGSGNASGENRAHAAIEDALNSPLLNDNHIYGARNVLLLIISGAEEITIDEISEINEYVQREAGGNTNIILGIGEDESLEDSIGVTIIATGFAADQQKAVDNGQSNRVVHILDDDHGVTRDLSGPSKEEEIEIPEVPRARVNTPPANPMGISFQPIRGKDLHKTEEQISLALDPSPVPSSIGQNKEQQEIPSSQNASKPHPEEPLNEEIEDEYEEEGFTFVIHDINENEDAEEIAADAHEETAVEELPLQEMSIQETSSEEDQDHVQFESAPLEDENTEEAEDERRVFVLDDLINLEKSFENEANERPEKHQQSAQKQETELEPELRMERRVQENKVEKSSSEPESDPFEKPISDSAQKMAHNRRARLESFNYRFKNNGNIKDAENVPAYKRQGVNINSESRPSQDNITGEMSVDEQGLKRNNRFLHDNVD
jgi:cell division protein FtsZ